MPKMGEEYELLVQRIFAQIVNAEFKGLKNIEIQHNVIIQGKANKHQIDVYWQFNIGGITYINIIEVKDRSRKVEQKDMQAFSYILQDIPGQPRGFFISKAGFQSGAIALAEQNGIKIMTLDKPDDSYWEGSIKEINIQMVLEAPHFTNVTTHVDEKWMVENKEKIDLIKSMKGIPMNGDTMLISDSEGKIIMPLNGLANKCASKYPNTGTIQHIAYAFENNEYYMFPDRNNTLIKARLLEFDLHYTVHEEMIHINAGDFVWFVLTDILEGTERVVDCMGNVRPPRPSK